MQVLLIVVVILASLSMCSKLDDVNQHLGNIEQQLATQASDAPEPQ